jgi:hypothetical protein
MASQAVDGKINTSKVWINLYLWEPFFVAFANKASSASSANSAN